MKDTQGSLPEALVVEVVTEVSTQMAEAQDCAQVAVGRFVQEQPNVARFLSAKMRHAPSGEALVHTVFHAELVAKCLRRHLGTQALRTVDFVALDQAATEGGEAPEEALATKAPALADYLRSNIEEAEIRGAAAMVALALWNVHCE